MDLCHHSGRLVKYRGRATASPYDKEAMVVHCLKQLEPKQIWLFVVWLKGQARVIPACQVQPAQDLPPGRVSDLTLAQSDATDALLSLAEKIKAKMNGSTSNPVLADTIVCPKGHGMLRFQTERPFTCDVCKSEIGQ